MYPIQLLSTLENYIVRAGKCLYVCRRMSECGWGFVFRGNNCTKVEGTSTIYENIKTTVVEQNNALSNVHSLIPKAYEYVTLCSKGDFVNMIEDFNVERLSLLTWVNPI
jgi:hypothetical protein